MDPPAYQEHAANLIPEEVRRSGARVRVIAGRSSEGTRGPVVQPLTEPLYLDVDLPAGVGFSEALPARHNGFLYIVFGSVLVEDAEGHAIRLVRDDLAVLSHGGQVTVQADDSDARFLLVAGRPLNEPVARGGPFVMNKQAEIRQAYADFEAGRF
jgi:hypothetical protein